MINLHYLYHRLAYAITSHTLFDIVPLQNVLSVELAISIFQDSHGNLIFLNGFQDGGI